jgi:DNA-binding transcriptional regulator/RsmH inhibitor MraZ
LKPNSRISPLAPAKGHEAIVEEVAAAFSPNLRTARFEQAFVHVDGKLIAVEFDPQTRVVVPSTLVNR